MSLASAIPAKALGSKTPERPKPIAPDAPRLRFSCATGEGFGSPVSSPVELHQRRNSVWMLNTKRQSHWRPAGFIGRDSPGRYCLWCGRLGCMCLCAAFWLARRRDACTTKFAVRASRPAIYSLLIKQGPEPRDLRVLARTPHLHPRTGWERSRVRLEETSARPRARPERRAGQDRNTKNKNQTTDFSDDTDKDGMSFLPYPWNPCDPSSKIRDPRCLESGHGPFCCAGCTEFIDRNQVLVHHRSPPGVSPVPAPSQRATPEH